MSGLRSHGNFYSGFTDDYPVMSRTHSHLCLLYPRKRTFGVANRMSAKCHKRTSLGPKAAESLDEPDRGRCSDEIGGSKARWSNWHGNDDACRSKGGQCYGNEHELPSLNP